MGLLEGPNEEHFFVSIGGRMFQLDREEFCLVGDKVDFYVGETQVGTIREIKEQKPPLDTTYPKVLVFNDEEGISYEVLGKNIICLHKDKETEAPEDLVESLCINFIADILPYIGNRQERIERITSSKSNTEWNYVRYIIWNSTISRLFTSILIVAEYQQDKDKYYFEKRTLENNPDIQEADKKILQYFVLLMKNDSKYFQNDGYKYFLYDNLASFVNSAMVSPSSSIVHPMYLCAITDTEFIVANIREMKTDIFSYSIDNEAKEINIPFSFPEALSTIVSLAYLLTPFGLNYENITIKYGEPTEIMQKARRFIELVTMWNLDKN